MGQDGKGEMIKTTLPNRWVPQFWTQVDGRAALYKEIQQRLSRLCEDAGIDSDQKRSLASRAVFVGLWLETQEVAAVTEGRFDPGPYVALCNCYAGLLAKLGIEKKPKMVDLREHIRRNYDEEGRAEA